MTPGRKTPDMVPVVESVGLRAEDGPATRASEGGVRLPWGSALLLAATHFAAFVDRALPAATAPLIKAEMGLSDAAIGGLQGPAFVALYVVGLLLAGHLVSRADPWKVAAACIGCWTLGGVLFALSPAFEGMVAGRILLGAGQAAFAPAALMILGGQSLAWRRSRMLSMFTTGSATGRSGAMLLGGALLAGFGGAALWGLSSWRWVCLLLMVPNLLLLVALVGAGRSAPAPPAAPGGGLLRALGAVRRQPAAFLGVAACGAGAVLLVQAAGAWAPSILNRAQGLSPAQAAMAFGAVILVFAPIGHLSAGWLLGRRRLGPATILAVGVLAAAASAWGLALAPGHAAAMAFLCALTAAGGLAAATTLITLQEMTEPPVKPAMGALFLTLTSLAGVGGGPWITGLVSDALTGDGGALGLALALTVTPVAVAVAGVALLAGRRGWSPARP